MYMYVGLLAPFHVRFFSLYHLDTQEGFFQKKRPTSPTNQQSTQIPCSAGVFNVGWQPANDQQTDQHSLGRPSVNDCNSPALVLADWRYSLH
jgi:hypothetical protein